GGAHDSHGKGGSGGAHGKGGSHDAHGKGGSGGAHGKGGAHDAHGKGGSGGSHGKGGSGGTHGKGGAHGKGADHGKGGRQAGTPGRDHHEVRAVARTADGQEITTGSTRLRTSTTDPAAGALTAHFEHATYHPGDNAVLSVDAPGHDHATIRFVIEKQGSGDAWTTLHRQTARVVSGHATTHWHVSIPGQTEDTQIRFQAIAPFSSSTSDPATVAHVGGGLTEPVWSHATEDHPASFNAGEHAQMQVTAEGLDGHRVEFHVEGLRGSTWSAYATARATVRSGVAQATITVHPPGHSSSPVTQLRFRANLAGAHADSGQQSPTATIGGGTQSVSAPAWNHPTYAAGDRATLSFTATGLDGQHVRLVVESQHGSTWQRAGETQATVTNGAGSATFRMPAAPHGSSSAAPVHYRFRALGHFTEVTSPEVTVGAAGGSAGLSSPEWSHAGAGAEPLFRHGQNATMRVQAAGQDGRRVRFRVERLEDGHWRSFSTVFGTVSGGVATASVHILHPGGRRPVHFRFNTDFAPASSR
ncbi:MAG: hypothetical protein JST92_21365, partial [Deltaproteobacteria bacterium]|nr:hypothetical protein [Deltaproteobacteria bacterium]